MTGPEKYWFGLNIFLSKYIFFWESSTLPILSQRYRHQMYEKTTFGNAVPVNYLFFCICFLKFGSNLLQSSFYMWNFPIILGIWFFFYIFITIYIYIYIYQMYTSNLLTCFAWGFWIILSFSLKDLTFTISL